MNNHLDMFRHTVATLAYRGGKALRGAPPEFAAFRAGITTRSPGEILAHLGDLLDWALSIADGRVHLTPANLASTLHRAIEAPTTARLLRAVFPEGTRFAHHPRLPAPLGDEGAANHIRLCAEHGGPGVELFTFGRRVADAEDPRPGPRKRDGARRQLLLKASGTLQGVADSVARQSRSDRVAAHDGPRSALR